MLAADGIVAAFVEQYAGRVAQIDDGVAHQLNTLAPPAAFGVFLGIARRHRLNQAHTVAAFGILLRGGYVHPADNVATALHKEVIGIVAEPRRHTHTHSGPFVGRTLGIAVHHDDTVVQSDHSVFEFRFSESGGCHYLIFADSSFHFIEIAVAPRPEMQSSDSFLSFQHSSFSGANVDRLTLEARYHFSVRVLDLDFQTLADRLVRLVSDLTFDSDSGFTRRDVEILAVDIGSRCSEVGIERQRLIYVVADVEPHVFVQAAVVGVEVAVAPLIARSGRRFLCFPGVVADNLDGVFAGLKAVGDVEAESHDAVVAVAERTAVEQHFGSLARALKLDEHFFTGGRLRQSEMFHITDLSG